MSSNFENIDSEVCYFDSACQTMRPAEVVQSQQEYFEKYNACGSRVKYAWGQRVDEEVSACRRDVIELFGHSEKDYLCAFTLNTTYGINLVLSQLHSERFNRIIVSEIEHNSVFVPAMTYAKRNNWQFQIFKRDQEGSLIYEAGDLERAVILLNAVSNIDGRKLHNIAEIVHDAHKRNSIVLVDAAQAVGHDFSFLKKIPFDGLFFSGHKTYAPSLGVMLLRRAMPQIMDLVFLGGGTVEDVTKDSFTLISDKHEMHALFEAGLQNFSGIIGLRAALQWRKNFQPEGEDPTEQQKALAAAMYQGLVSNPKVIMVNTEPSPVISFYAQNIGGHMLAMLLSEQKIMVRSGYFCCHYYLNHCRNLPPLVRVSIGLNNTHNQVYKTVDCINTIINNT